ncbi:type II toxin-antitoxin system RelE/ParE family toxin [Phormidium sp. CCY1219]|uniref:type II toxin-antitoxin system RelE/ParE family toxin n=1 Tax=Phormidium sp. CCY1219 TaxID=2886104 RepID=UPI002D1EF67E|nr:type II toxin-antitoxin system RelE/ParE family toxin [Phormidium sp. CCY1219]MEB3830956.1 type II toxin-antitoxin system RelE/ParE family toxin [Phormidium sp. CCY1219]
MSRYIISPQARLDLREINQYVMGNNPAAARRLREKMKQQCQRLADFPKMGRRWEQLNPPLRSFPVDNYLILSRNPGWDRGGAGGEWISGLAGYFPVGG